MAEGQAPEMEIRRVERAAEDDWFTDERVGLVLVNENTNTLKTPDFTTAQIVALFQPFVTATVGLLVAFGVEMTNTQQTALMSFTLALAGFISGALVIADAIIRSGRARALAATPPAQSVDKIAG